MSTWTLEHAKAIVAAWPEVEIYLIPQGWSKVTVQRIDMFHIEALGDPNFFRLPPKKKVVEWTASDVKPGMVFRTPGMLANWLAPASVGSRAIEWHLGGSVGWHDLLKSGWQYSFDAVTWFPCSREVDQ